MAKDTKKELEFTHTALSVFQNKDKEWCLAFIKFNPDTGETKFEKATAHGMSQLDAVEQFKIQAVDTGNVM